jgi:hypothetical protein
LINGDAIAVLLVTFRRPKADTYNGFMMLEQGVGEAERLLFVIMIGS